MKKILFAAALFSTIFLGGCFGGDETETAEKKIPGFAPYAAEGFKTQIPEDWEVVSPAKFTQNIPANTLIAFKNNIRNPRFTANVIILKNALTAEILSLDYAKLLERKMANELTAYRILSSDVQKINVGDQETDTILLHAEGRESPEADVKRFIQVSAVKGASAFVALGAYDIGENEETVKKITTILTELKLN